MASRKTINREVLRPLHPIGKIFTASLPASDFSARSGIEIARGSPGTPAGGAGGGGGGGGGSGRGSGAGGRGAADSENSTESGGPALTVISFSNGMKPSPSARTR